MLNREAVLDAVQACLIKAGTSFRPDQVHAYREAIEGERNRNAKWVLERILENAMVAKGKRFPLCDDTGIPHVFLEIGNRINLPAGWLLWIQEGIVEGLRSMPGRPMAVKGSPRERVEQSMGLFRDPGKLAPGAMVIKPVSGKGLRITVLLLGGGPEIRAKTHRIFHKRSLDIVLDEATKWLTSEVKSLGCTPCIPAIGVGRTHTEATTLMLEAMRKGNLKRQSPMEKRVTASINATGVGPLGLGGNTTALGTFIRIGPLRASGVRIVSVRPCCCFEPRRGTVSMNEKT